MEQKKSLITKRLIPHSKPLKLLVGWQEWCALPKFNLPAIKAKIDTAAKTSALHASEILPFYQHGELYVNFVVPPLQRSQKFAVPCTAMVIDQRTVKNSGGHKELRYVVKTQIKLGDIIWTIDITLTNRDPMIFRMLLGRDALKGHSIIDPGQIFCHGKLNVKDLRSLYSHTKDPRTS